MARAISLRPFPYILKSDRDRPKAEQTIFTLRMLSADENAQISDSVKYQVKNMNKGMPDVEFKSGQARTTVENLRIGLKNWGDNFQGDDGEPVMFQEPVAPQTLCPIENINRIHPDDRDELADVISEGSHLKESDEKKSLSGCGSQQEEKTDLAENAPGSQD